MEEGTMIDWAADAEERWTYDRDLMDPHQQLWRHVAWAGLATGRVYPLGDNDVMDDPAGYAPLWLLVEDEPLPDCDVEF